MLPVLLRIHSFITQKNKREETLRTYSSILANNFHYFDELSIEEKDRFLNRVYRYRKSKKFHFVEQEESVEMEVMISAAAVQLTFGMEDYKMNFFNDIYVTKDAYTYGVSSTPWAGHVNRNGIYISWNHFKQGYKYRNDRYNVGLHEMAHALEYEFQYGDAANDEMQKQNFESVMRQVGGVLQHEEWQRGDLYTDEALQNKHECWAESIELFFENPWELQQHYPELYIGIVFLLKQDPLKTSS